MAGLVLPLALLIGSAAAGCGVRCESREESYSGPDVLYRTQATQVTAEEILAQSMIQFAQERSWVPNPSEYEQSQGDPIPPLPYMGSTLLEVKVTPLSSTLTDSYIHEDEFGCQPLDTPEAPVLVVVRTADGVLHEEVRGTVTHRDGRAYIRAVIKKPVGTMKEYFAAHPASSPRIVLEITPESARLLLTLERVEGVVGYVNYITVL